MRQERRERWAAQAKAERAARAADPEKMFARLHRPGIKAHMGATAWAAKVAAAKAAAIAAASERIIAAPAETAEEARKRKAREAKRRQRAATKKARG